MGLDESALTKDRQWTIDALAERLAWRGTARQFQIAGLTERMATAINQRAVMLGIADLHLPDTVGDAKLSEYNGVIAMIETGTPEKHLAADKLIAYIDGLTDALTDEYGRRDEPVELARADVQALVRAALSGAGAFAPEVGAAVDRAQRVLGVAAQRP